MSEWEAADRQAKRRKGLNLLRDDAVHALREMTGLQIAGSTDAQVDLAGKYAVSAIARYTIACQEA